VTSHISLKGEASVMVSLPKGVKDAVHDLPAEDLVKHAARDFRGGASLKDLLQKYGDLGYKRSDLYRLLLEAKDLT
jgi:hypothetical protein